MGLSIREALTQAIDKGEVDVPERPTEDAPLEDVAQEAAPEVEAPALEAAEDKPASVSGRDERGRFAKQDKPVEPKVAAVAPTPKPQPAKAPAPVAPAEAQPATLKPPQSWKPTAREKWGALPPEVQQDVLRRESETARALQESAEARKNWDAFRQVVSPYEAMLRAEGADPIRAAAGLFQTAAALRTAPVAHKAAIVAQMVNTYGIPVEALAQALDGRQPQTQQPAAVDPGSIAAQVRQQLMAELQQSQQQQLIQKGAAEVDAFSNGKDFFDDVREMMGDMMEVAARRGLPLSLEEAYNQAIRLHPEVSKVVQQREAAKQANALQASTQRARAAASSVRSRPAAPVLTDDKPKDLRSTIAAAMEAHSGR